MSLVGLKILLSFAIALLFSGQITEGAKCSGELGMQSKRIPDENITSSSQLSSNHAPAFARLDGPRAWCSAPGDISPYIQILLDEEKLITAIKTQGSSRDFSWSRKYDIRYLKEGKWTSYIENLTGNKNIRWWHMNEFDPPIKTRSIRIYPKDPLAVMMDDTVPLVPCLRLELYGCSAPASCHVLQAPGNGKIHNNDTKHGALVYFTCNNGFQLKGLRQITCVEGKWNGSTPTCEVGNVFLFPQKGVTDYVIVPGMRSLSAVTACFWMKTADTVNSGTPLSYAVSRQHNEFLVHNYKSFHLHVGGVERNTGISATDGGWHHICTTWENTAGSWKLYKDGAVAALGQGLKNGYVIRGAGSLVLGQEQDSVAGSFNATQSFIGEMAGVNIWSRALGSHEIATLAQSSCTAGEGNVYKWSDFISSRRGGVQLIHASCPV